MSEFETKVLERLTSIEAKAENYITWKTVVFGLIAGAGGLLAYGELQFSRIDSRFEQRLSEAASAIGGDVAKSAQAAESTILSAFENALETGVEQPKFVDWATAYGLDSAKSITFTDFGVPKISYFEPATARELTEMWGKFEESFGMEISPKTYSLDELYIRNENGDFVPAFTAE